jgi:hypothetical protein
MRNTTRARDYVSAEILLVCGTHHLLVNVRLDPAARQRRLFNVAALCQAYLKNASHPPFRKRVIGSAGMAEGKEFQTL